jgi:hypothetical protein
MRAKLTGAWTLRSGLYVFRTKKEAITLVIDMVE